MNKQIQYLDWGIIEYEEALRKQEILFSDTIERKKKWTFYFELFHFL